MRISDWSSDVCSSDLLAGARGLEVLRRLRQHAAIDRTAQVGGDALANPADLIEAAGAGAAPGDKIGRASCRDRVCQYVSISVVAVSLKKKHTTKTYEIQKAHTRSKQKHTTTQT